MNFLIKMGAKAFLKSNNKSKIIAGIASTAFFLFILPIVPAMAAVAPFAAVVEGAGELGEKAKGFFEAAGEKAENLFQGRGFTIIDEKDVKTQEEAVYDKLRKKYDDFSGHVTLDISLIAATVYYPMTFVYDDKALENLSAETDLDEQTEEQYQDVYDYYKKVKNDFIDKLVNNSISQTVITYKCETKTFTDSAGTTTTYYVPGEQLESSGKKPFSGNFEEDGKCAEGVDSIKTYIYANDSEMYDDYLKDTHICTDNNQKDCNKAYEPLFKDLEGDAKTTKLDSVISDIHSLRGLYASVIGIDESIAGGYSTLCTSGVMVSIGSDPTADTGVFSLEEYVAGVVTHENDYKDSNDPDNIEAMKAQAIAARTYLLKKTNNCNIPIVNDTGSQTFSKNASARAKKATMETAGMVLTYNGEIFSSEYDAYYCNEVAVCLAGGDCTCEYTKLPNGEKHMVSIPTNAIQYGGGGHGRGMSQDLADYMQTEGNNYKQILEYFYSPGVQITVVGATNGKDGAVTVVGNTDGTNGTYYVPKDMPSGLAGSKGSAKSGFNIYFWQQLSKFLDAAKAATGYDIDYTDAWRSYDDQIACYNDEDKIDDKGTETTADDDHLCAKPGTSMHGWGIAADLDFYEVKAAQDWAHAHAAEYGLDFAVCKDYFGGNCVEPWHVQPINIVKGQSW